MLQRKPINLPETIYPVHPWKIIERRYHPQYVQQTESIFSLSNGYLGMRGSFEEAAPVFENGTYINGFFETWPISYGEEAHGFAKEGQTIVNVTDTKVIKLYVDGERFELSNSNLLEFERTLDMRAGTLDRKLVWETAKGKRVAVSSRRIVSLERMHLAAIAYEVEVQNGDALVEISSEMNNDEGRRLRSGDPRLYHAFKRRVLVPQVHVGSESRIVLGHRTEKSGLNLVCGIDHTVRSGGSEPAGSECTEQEGKVLFRFRAREGVPISLTKYMAYHTSGSDSIDQLSGRVGRTLDRARNDGFNALLGEQRRRLDEFFDRADIELTDDPSESEHPPGQLQQALRLNLFHIFQAAFRAGENSIPAKGLTGQAYDGNYFWDTEAYVLPVLIHTYPEIARNVLDFRYRLLSKARKRAREVGERGALFPWRTIDGEEASAYYAAGTAQYHIDGDIMFALQQYVQVTGDDEYLWSKGAEMLAETARMWYGLGFFSERRDGRFCIHGVTGPDEYTTVVDNNLYTNLVAQNNLRYAVETLEKLKRADEARFGELVRRIDLRPNEPEEWSRAADEMFLPYDERLGINPQDDTFLNKKVWDFEHTPEDQYPLLLHFHPLVIYRQQVLKQPDVALAMFLFGDRFSREQKRRNFDYYDPLTTGDSSLSVCIQSIMAHEVGHDERALEYARYAVLMDLGNVEGNVKDGCHIASFGGSWMLCVNGFAGMREYGGRLSFAPRLPHGIRRLSFPLLFRGRRLRVTIEGSDTTYLLREGEPLVFSHFHRTVELTEGECVTLPVKSE
ncbi:glycoside hydrolase family 65 protein [Salinispira pacifica]